MLCNMYVCNVSTINIYNISKYSKYRARVQCTKCVTVPERPCVCTVLGIMWSASEQIKRDIKWSETGTTKFIYCTVQNNVYSTVQCVQYSTMCTVQYNVYSTVQCVQYSAMCIVQHNDYSTLQYNVYSTVQYSTMCTLYSTVQGVKCTVQYNVYTVQYSTVQGKTVKYIFGDHIQFCMFFVWRNQYGMVSRVQKLPK